jgi:hypothetical protein
VLGKETNMRRLLDAPARSAVALVALVLLASVLLTASGCRSKDTPKSSSKDAVESTGTVQATLPTQTPAASDSTASSSPSKTATSASSPATTAVKPVKPKPAVPAIWPAKVGRYAKSVKSPTWYPRSIPAGYKVNSLDIVEFDPGSGLVCDMVFLKGDKALMFTQGSPKNRSYGIVSVEKVPWGTETADVVRLDPADPTSPAVIVYNKGGNFAELQGDLSLAELKAIAKSMVRVK